MSNAVFPTPILAEWDYTWPIKRSPLYSTIIQSPVNKIGCTHISLTPYTTWVYELDLAFLKGSGNSVGGSSAFQTVVGFFGARRGSYDTWLYLDPFDNGIDTSGNPIVQSIGPGDGSTTVFEMTRTMGSGLIDLIQNWVSPPKVYVNGNLLSGSIFPSVSSGDYYIDQFGTITFTSAPGNTYPIVWTGQFYFRCHFQEDTLGSLQMDLSQIWSCRSLRFETELV